MNIKALFETKTDRRMAEMEVQQLKDILALTANVPGDTLVERIKFILTTYPTLQPKTPPAQMQTIEAV